MGGGLGGVHSGQPPHVPLQPHLVSHPLLVLVVQEVSQLGGGGGGALGGSRHSSQPPQSPRPASHSHLVGHVVVWPEHQAPQQLSRAHRSAAASGSAQRSVSTARMSDGGQFLQGRSWQVEC